MATRLKQRTLVCITGPESSGKTVLATQLGQHFAAPVAAEFARAWLQRRGGRYTESSLEVIAAGQLDNEHTATRQQSDAPMVFADTDIQVLEIWWWVRFASPALQRRYAFRAPPRRLYPTWLQTALRRRTPRCYLLVGPDLVWEPDPLRESPVGRAQLFDQYRRVLQRDGLDYATVYDHGAARLQQALKGLNRLGYPNSAMRAKAKQ